MVVCGGGGHTQAPLRRAACPPPKTYLICLGIIRQGVPRVMLRDACTEGNEEQKRQEVAFIFIATVVVNQAEATDEAWRFQNSKDNN